MTGNGIGSSWTACMIQHLMPLMPNTTGTKYQLPGSWYVPGTARLVRLARWHYYCQSSTTVDRGLAEQVFG